MPPPLVIFDFDGTIADSGSSIVLTAHLALEQAGEAPIDGDTFRTRIGLPLHQIFTEVVPGITPQRLDAVVACYRSNFAPVSQEHTTIFPGMLDLLDALHDAGSTLAIATGKSTVGAHKSLARLDIAATRFAMVVGTDAVPAPKPNPDMVQHITNTLSIPASDAIVIGDTTFDMQMSSAANIRCFGVTWGSHSRAQLEDANATWIVDTVPALHTQLMAL